MKPAVSVTRAILLTMFGAVCISFAAIFVKALTGSGVGPTAIAFWRMAFGSAALFLLLVIQRSSLHLPRIAVGWAIAAGFAFCVDLYFWHRSIFYVGAALATILAMTQVFCAGVIGAIVFRERLTLKFWIAAVAAMGGVTLLIGVGDESVSFTTEYLLGVLFGLITGISYANYMMCLKKAGQTNRMNSFVALIAWTSLFCALFLGIVAGIEGTLTVPHTWSALLLLLALGLVPQAAGWVAISTALPHLKSSQSSLVLLLQAVLATTWGRLIFDERFSWLQLFGATITLVAIYLGSVRDTDLPMKKAAQEGRLV